MANPNHDVERWLADEAEGHDAAAEARFAQLFAALPRIDPGPAFFEQTVQAAWQARIRRRRLVVLARLAASLLVVVGGMAVAYGAMAYGGAVLVTTGVAIASRAMVGPIVFVANSIQWWSTLARAAATVGDAIATPANQAVLISMELWCVFALYGLHRLLRNGIAEPAK